MTRPSTSVAPRRRRSPWTAVALLTLALGALRLDDGHVGVTVVQAATPVPEQCSDENPNLWALRFNLGQGIDLQSCSGQCVQGGGNGYFCLSRVTGMCLCGTSAKPKSTNPARPDACTATCSSGAACGGPPSAYSCYAGATQPTGPCPETPSTDCSVGKGSLSVHIRSEREQVLRWKWRRGTVERTDLGDPLTTTGYHACLYADGALIDTVSVEPGTDWYRRENGDVAFLRREGNDDGVTQLTLHPSTRGRIWLEGHGTALDLTEPPLEYSSSVDVQLHTDDGACWSATFPAPARRNRIGRFYDR